MPIYIGSTQMKKVYNGSSPFKEVYVGREKLWSDDVIFYTLTINQSDILSFNVKYKYAGKINTLTWHRENNPVDSFQIPATAIVWIENIVENVGIDGYADPAYWSSFDSNAICSLGTNSKATNFIVDIDVSSWKFPASFDLFPDSCYYHVVLYQDSTEIYRFDDIQNNRDHILQVIPISNTAGLTAKGEYSKHIGYGHFEDATEDLQINENVQDQETSIEWYLKITQ